MLQWEWYRGMSGHESKNLVEPSKALFEAGSSPQSEDYPLPYRSRCITLKVP